MTALPCVIVTEAGLKVLPLVAVTVPIEVVIGVEGVPAQAKGSKAKRPQAPQNKSVKILFMAVFL